MLCGKILYILLSVVCAYSVWNCWMSLLRLLQ